MSSADVAESGRKTVFYNWVTLLCLLPLFDCLTPFFEDVVVLIIESQEFFGGVFVCLRLFFLVGVF